MKRSVVLATITPPPYRADSIQLALYYLKAYFLKHSRKPVNIHIKTFAGKDDVKSVVADITASMPEIVGFSCYVWNILKVLDAARALKEILPGVKIVLGGAEVSPRARRLMRSHAFIDVIVIGEGERAFRELADIWIDGRGDLSAIDGIAFRKNGRVVLTNRRSTMTDLSEIPSPYLEGVVDKKTLMKYRGDIPTETLRGCAFRCHYCYYHKDFKDTAYFPLESVERELKYLFSMKPRGIYLMDPTFNFNTDRAKKILRMFIKYGKGTRLHVELKAELLDAEMVRLLRDSKAYFIEIGIQSTNKDTLRLINRHFDREKFKKNIGLLNKAGLSYETQLIDGLPGDNYERLKSGVAWLIGMGAKNIKIMRLMLLPGTYLRTHAKRFGIRYGRRAPYHSIESGTFPPGDLKRTEKLRAAMQSIWNLGLLGGSIGSLSGKLKIPIEDIIEEWIGWSKKVRPSTAGAQKDEDSRLKRVMRAALISKEANSALDFVEKLCRKHTGLPMDKDLSFMVERDIKTYMRKRGLRVKRVTR